MFFSVLLLLFLPRYSVLFSLVATFVTFQSSYWLNCVCRELEPIIISIIIITLRAKLSGAVYCNRSCLWVCNGRAGRRASGVCYHDNSKLRASIFTKLGLWVQVVTISSWLNLGGPAPPPPGRGSAAGPNWDPPNNFWRKRAIRFKYGTDIQDGASLCRDHKTTPKWAWPGSRDLIS